MDTLAEPVTPTVSDIEGIIFMKSEAPFRIDHDVKESAVSRSASWMLSSAVVCGLTMSGWAMAQEEPSLSDVGEIKRQLSEQSAKLGELARAIGEQERELAENKKQLFEQRRKVEQLLQRYSGRGAPGSGTQAAPSDSVQTNPIVAQAEPPAKPVGQAPEQKDARPTDIAPIFQTPGVLTPPGKFVIEPAIQYAHSTDNRVALIGFTVIPAITIGLIDIRRISRDIFTGLLTTRWGVTNRFELEARLPYVYRTDTTITRAISTPSVTESVFEASGNNIGDIDFAGRYQLNEGGADKPYYVGALRFKTRTGKSPFETDFDNLTNLPRTLPTGSGFYSIQPGLTALIPSDPAVFFGGINYTHSFQRDVGNGFGTIKPGGILGFNFGMGLSLNERATVSFGYDHAVVMKPRQQDAVSASRTLGPSSTTQLGTLLLGYSFRVSKDRNLNLSLGVGATREAPDLQLTLRYPMTF
jgi:hypothetical protein